MAVLFRRDEHPKFRFENGKLKSKYLPIDHNSKDMISFQHKCYSHVDQVYVEIYKNIYIRYPKTSKYQA